MINLRNSFPGQKRDESIFIFLRRHPVAYLPLLLIFGLMIIIGIIIFLIVLTSSFFTGSIYNIGILVANSFLLASISFMYIGILDLYFDIHIVTDHRIVDIHQNRLFSRQIDELALEDIEDVSSSVQGILSTFFNFGNIEVQTAGTKPNFLFENIPNPREVCQLILDLANQAKRGIEASERISTLDIQGIIGSELVNDPKTMVSLGAMTQDKEDFINKQNGQEAKSGSKVYDNN